MKLHQALAGKTEPLRKADMLWVRWVLDPDAAVTPMLHVTPMLCDNWGFVGKTGGSWTYLLGLRTVGEEEDWKLIILCFCSVYLPKRNPKRRKTKNFEWVGGTAPPVSNGVLCSLPLSLSVTDRSCTEMLHLGQQKALRTRLVAWHRNHHSITLLWARALSHQGKSTATFTGNQSGHSMSVIEQKANPSALGLKGHENSCHLWGKSG